MRQRLHAHNHENIFLCQPYKCDKYKFVTVTIILKLIKIKADISTNWPNYYGKSVFSISLCALLVNKLDCATVTVKMNYYSFKWEILK